MGVVARDYQLQIADSPRFFVCVYLNQERAITEYAENPIQSRLRIIIVKMKTNEIIFSCTLIATMLTMTSCFGPKKISQRIIPTAVNTINSVRLDELNLKHGSDYSVVNSVTGEAVIIYQEKRKGDKIIIKEENGEFEIVYEWDNDTDKWRRTDFQGIARFGFFSNDDYNQSYSMKDPEYVVRNLAIYRLINASKVRGADGIIEPVISTNVEQRGNDIVFKTTATAKLIKLKTDGK